MTIHRAALRLNGFTCSDPHRLRGSFYMGAAGPLQAKMRPERGAFVFQRCPAHLQAGQASAAEDRPGPAPAASIGMLKG